MGPPVVLGRGRRVTRLPSASKCRTTEAPFSVTCPGETPRRRSSAETSAVAPSTAMIGAFLTSSPGSKMRRPCSLLEPVRPTSAESTSTGAPSIACKRVETWRVTASEVR